MPISADRLQRYRLIARTAFFMLFVVAPPLDIFRLDLTLGHFILFGTDWTLGLDGFVNGEVGAGGAALNLVLRGLLPIILVVGFGVWLSWRYGRLYCGWLCPHFSVVESINALMRRAWGRPTLWERRPLPEQLPDGRHITPRAVWWLAVALAIVGFAVLWAVTLLTYLLPPAQVWGNLFSGELTRNQSIFITAASLAFIIEFLLARHLFCRFGCAVGLFQSLAWMANRRAMVVGFKADRAVECKGCDNACDNACPMRLKPRGMKRRMFTCTQCARCLQACDQVQADNPAGSLLHWIEGAEAASISDSVLKVRDKPVRRYACGECSAD
ncbi:MAG: 4Fe-4S binding protein [Thiohalomonadaceae bacterium]